MTNKLILIINTSETDGIFLGLAKDDFLIAKKIIKTKFKHSEKLLPTIDEFLKKNKIKLQKLNAIGAVTGPGSYTSLKIGLTVANTLAWGLDIPVFGIRKDEFENEHELAKKIYKQIRNSKKFKNIVEPFYEGQAYYE